MPLGLYTLSPGEGYRYRVEPNGGKEACYPAAARSGFRDESLNVRGRGFKWRAIQASGRGALAPSMVPATSRPGHTPRYSQPRNTTTRGAPIPGPATTANRCPGSPVIVTVPFGGKRCDTDCRGTISSEGGDDLAQSRGDLEYFPDHTATGNSRSGREGHRGPSR